jgi:hypothetical protein
MSGYTRPVGIQVTQILGIMDIGDFIERTVLDPLITDLGFSGIGRVSRVAHVNLPEYGHFQAR